MLKKGIIIDGKYIANQVLKDLKVKIDYYSIYHNCKPKLCIILIGNDEASSVYIKNKIKAAEKVNIITELIKFEENITEHLLLKDINNLNQDPTVSGIIVQLPLPSHISNEKVVNAINPLKDVDGFSPVNVGLLYSGFPVRFVPCTAKGCLELIKTCEKNLSSKKIIVIGRSNIVGRPLAALLLRENCTVTICHSQTKDLMNITSAADIIVSAIGKPRFLTKEYFNSSAIVIDVGINKIMLENKSQLVGDVDFPNVKDKVKYITPVPGGVGPMTVAYLLVNTFEAMISNLQ